MLYNIIPNIICEIDVCVDTVQTQYHRNNTITKLLYCLYTQVIITSNIL